MQQTRTPIVKSLEGKASGFWSTLLLCYWSRAIPEAVKIMCLCDPGTSLKAHLLSLALNIQIKTNDWMFHPSLRSHRKPPKPCSSMHEKPIDLNMYFTFVENANVMAEERCTLHVKWRDFFSWLWMRLIRTNRDLLFHYPHKYHLTPWNSNWIRRKEIWFLSQISFLLLGTIPTPRLPSPDKSLL